MTPPIVLVALIGTFLGVPIYLFSDDQSYWGLHVTKYTTKTNATNVTYMKREQMYVDANLLPKDTIRTIMHEMCHVMQGRQNLTMSEYQCRTYENSPWEYGLFELEIRRRI